VPRPFETVGELAPGLSHPQEEKLALRIGQARGYFHAIGGVQPVAGDVLLAHQVFPDAYPLCLLTSLQVASCGIVPMCAFDASPDFHSPCVLNAAMGMTPLILWNLLTAVAFVVVPQTIEALL
jgi:hypothetical protein